MVREDFNKLVHGIADVKKLNEQIFCKRRFLFIEYSTRVLVGI